MYQVILVILHTKHHLFSVSKGFMIHPNMSMKRGVTFDLNRGTPCRKEVAWILEYKPFPNGEGVQKCENFAHVIYGRSLKVLHKIIWYFLITWLNCHISKKNKIGLLQIAMLSSSAPYNSEDWYHCVPYIPSEFWYRPWRNILWVATSNRKILTKLLYKFYSLPLGFCLRSCSC